MSPDRYRRMLARRELHRSRSVAVSVVLALIALGAAWLGTESVLAAVDARPLLLAPSTMLDAWRTGETPAILGAAAGCAVVGIFAVVVALLPGRLARHRVQDARSVILVEDGVLASAVSRTVSRGSGVAPDRVRTAIGRRRADVLVQPTSGHPLDPAEVQELADRALTELRPLPAIRPRTRVATQGVVGG